MMPPSAIPVLRPQLPTADELLPYLRRIDEARWYSNHGPLLRDLEERIAVHFGVTTDHCAIVANGTVALSAALVAAGARSGDRCLLPSWTFVGSAAAVWAANLRPHFVDVDESTWMLDPVALAERDDLDGVGAVMVVSAFGSPVETAAWDAFTDKTGIPVIIDCAASFDTVASVDRARAGRSPTMVSLHATKSFGIGEGGVVLSTDDAFVQRFRQVCNFGVWGPASGQILGYNGKLNEYNAAVGLAAIVTWPRVRERLARKTEIYREAFADQSGLALLPTYGDGWVSSYCIVRTEKPALDVIDALRSRGVETRRWWQGGVHRQAAYRQFQRDGLPVTERLAEHVFGLPFFASLSDEDQQTVIAATQAAL